MSRGSERTEWYWVCHMPAQGAEKRYYGQLDVAPQPVPPERARCLQQLLPDHAVWVSSPLSRAVTTGLALTNGKAPITVGDFTEQDFGKWQGRSFADVFAENRSLDWTQPQEIVPPGGESFYDLGERVADAIDRLSEHYAGQAIVAVAHQSIIRVAIAYALELHADQAWRVSIAPLSLTRLGLQIKDGKKLWSVGCINADAGQ